MQAAQEGRIGRRADDDESRFSVSITRSHALIRKGFAERRARRDAAEAVSLTDETPESATTCVRACKRRRRRNTGDRRFTPASGSQCSDAPIINKYWVEDAFKELNVGGLGIRGYGCAGGSQLLVGLVAMEMARFDASIATFFRVHSGLAMAPPGGRAA